MEQDLFQLLPSEIIIGILSRLPVRAIVMSKCVCKPWLDLLSSDDFVNSHLSKSAPALAALIGEEGDSIWCKVFEIEGGGEADEDDVERRYYLVKKFEFGDEVEVEVDDDDDDDDVERRYNPLTKFVFKDRADIIGKFEFRDGADIIGAVDGLLLLKSYLKPFDLYICNPFTREIVELPLPCFMEDEGVYPSLGFGASKITGHHKVVHIFHKPELDCGRHKCQVYTLETGSWRCFEVTAEFRHILWGVFVNGNLHWIGSDSIACFDLETECLSMFSPPPLLETADDTSLCVFKDYLCVCAALPLPSENYEFAYDIWLLKEYGVEKSWTKEYVYFMHVDPCDYFYPLKVFKDGDLLFSSQRLSVCHYSNKTLTARKIGVLHPLVGYPDSLLLTPSLLSLKRNLGMENVITF